MAGVALVVTVLTACGMRGPFDHNSMNPERMQEVQSKIIERVSDDLVLSAEQKSKLQKVAEVLNVQHKAMHEPGGEPINELKSLIGGSTLDQERASKLMLQKAEAMKNGGPKLISALADFYDNLSPKQQAQLRERLDKGPRW